MTKHQTTINRLKELIAILESNVKVVRADFAQGLGEPMSMTLDGTTWSHVYKVEIEMYKSQEGNK